MNQILNQLGELLLNSIPTIIFLVITVAAYKFLVYKPLLRVLDQRYRLTEGAFERAKTDIAAAEMRTQEYEQRIREARIAIFKQRLRNRRSKSLPLPASATPGRTSPKSRAKLQVKKRTPNSSTRLRCARLRGSPD